MLYIYLMFVFKKLNLILFFFLISCYFSLIVDKEVGILDIVIICILRF